MAKVVVTGGAGFIGAHLVDKLVNNGNEVHVIDNLTEGLREDRLNPQAMYHEFDIRDLAYPECAMSEMRGAQTLFHLAALPRVQQSIDNPIETHDVNVNGTLAVLEAARNAGVKRVVYSASSSAYGMSEKLPISETDPTAPMSPYAAQKLMSELLCQTWYRTYGLETVCLRYFNVYGPKLDPDGPYALVVGIFLKQMRAGVPLTITGDGTQTRDFTHVSDVIRANILAAESSEVGKGEVINIGAGRNASINELAKMFGGPVVYIAPRLEPKHNRADNRHAEVLLGWKPTVKLEDGIEELKKLNS